MCDVYDMLMYQRLDGLSEEQWEYVGEMEWKPWEIGIDTWKEDMQENKKIYKYFNNILNVFNLKIKFLFFKTSKHNCSLSLKA